MKVKIFEGNCLNALKSLPDESVHTVVTSPPFFGLRNYGTNPQIWGGKSSCKHDWTTIRIKRPNSSGGPSKKQAIKGVRNFKESTSYYDRASYSDTCNSCGAWQGELGMEPTPQLFVKHISIIFKEIWRVLHKSGVLWINIADSYNGSGGAGGDYNEGGIRDGQPKYPGRHIKGLKSGDLCGIPWMIAMNLRDNGWYLRASNIWAKGISFCPFYSGSVMPESMNNRTTRSHEYVFMMAKSKKYFYDNEAVREPLGTGRNLRSVWSVPLQPYTGAHFACFPEALVDPCVKAGTSEKGVCSKCGDPYERIIEKIKMSKEQNHKNDIYEWDDNWARNNPDEPLEDILEHKTTGWKPTCKCMDAKPVPATVLDPFGGSGTTALVAHNLDRNSISIELNPQYCDLQEKRLKDAADLFIDIERILI